MMAGGIDRYNGQILWCSMAGRGIYPTPIYDAVISDMSTEEGLGNIKNRNARNNFLVSAMLVTKRGVPKIDDNGNEVAQPTIVSKVIAEDPTAATDMDHPASQSHRSLNASTPNSTRNFSTPSASVNLAFRVM